MGDLLEFSRLIAARHDVSLSPAGEEIPLSILASLDQTVRSDGQTALHLAVHETLLRLGETHVLGNLGIVRLIELWDGIVGTARERIEHHLTGMLGGMPDQDLVSYIFRCLSGSAARRGRGSGDHTRYFQDVVERLSINAKDDKGLRCECCGYHFRVKDIARDKVSTILDLGLTFDSSLFPGRADDLYKPIQREKESYTRFSIDHVVPEETLGWSESDNLEVLCGFCNSGKMAFRRPLEAISSFAIGGLAEVPRSRSFSGLKHQIIVAALRSQGGQCSHCRQDRRHVEMTVRPVIRLGDNVLHGFAPWNLRTLCYRCINAVNDDDRDENPPTQT